MTDTIALETSQYALEVDKEELEAQPEVILNMLKTLDDPKAIAQPRNMFTAIQISIIHPMRLGGATRVQGSRQP
jgi:hypothetical protein